MDEREEATRTFCEREWSMEQTRQQERASLSSLSRQTGYQNILIDILRTALEPLPLKTKITRILDYLLSLDHLHLGSKAGLFVVNQDSDTLDLLISRGFPAAETIACKTTRFGICHCGQTGKSGKIGFFDTVPAFFDSNQDSAPFVGNYCVPIIKDSQTLGVLTLYVLPGHRSSTEMEELLEAIANILAVIIESQQMDQQLIQLVNDLRGSIINLREEKKFSESIIQGLNHGLIVADLDGKIRKSNSVAQTIFKSFVKLLDGQYLADFLGDSASAELLATTPGKSGQMEKELTFVTPTRDKKIIGYSNVPREDAKGNKVGVIISLSDISELKYVRKEMEKMNRLSTVAEIASAVAHEVRNPLAGIKIMAQSIEEEAKDNSEQLECSQRIIRQVDRLNELLSDFFSYARPAEPNKRPTSLTSIVAETMPLINNRLSKNHITFTQDVSGQLPRIIADPHQVQQVLLNLFLNAIDAIKESGHIEIYASLLTPHLLKYYKKSYPALLGRRHNYVILRFTDNGAGMPPHVAEQVFEPFFTTKTSGAGLGLAIVYRTLKENDAEIVLDSKAGKGTTFTIFFRADV
jgi:nitrogen-specific signal transduction histidine kinase/putative methionine-R-sulfoxide reductase with GAF domain